MRPLHQPVNTSLNVRIGKAFVAQGIDYGPFWFRVMVLLVTIICILYSIAAESATEQQKSMQTSANNKGKPKKPGDVKESKQPNKPFRSCAEARAAGAAPVMLGDPGYSPRLDRDGDGVGCES